MTKTNHFSFPSFTELSQGDQELSVILKQLKTSSVQISMKGLMTLNVAESATIRHLMRTAYSEKKLITWCHVNPEISGKFPVI